MKKQIVTSSLIVFGIILLMPVSFGAICTDTDGGKNIYQKGTTGVITKYTDYCSSSTTLREYYCSGIYLASAKFQCSYGCSNGACLKQTTSLCGNNILDGSEE